MAQFDDFVPPRKDDLVFSHDGSAPHRGDPDLIAASGLTDTVAVIDIFRRLRPRGGCGVGQHEGRTAGGVHLAVVVALYNLNVIALQDGGGFFDQGLEDADAQGHIGGAEDGDGCGRRFNLGQLRLAEAGGAQHEGEPPGRAEGQQGGEGGGTGEVHDHVGLAGKFSGGGEYGEFPVGSSQKIEAGGNGKVRIGLAEGGDDAAHVAVTAGNN